MKILARLLILFTFFSFISSGGPLLFQCCEVRAAPDLRKALKEDLLDLDKRLNDEEPDLQTWEFHVIKGLLYNTLLAIVPPEGATEADAGGVSYASAGLTDIISNSMVELLENTPSLYPMHHLADMFRIPVKTAYAQTGTDLLGTWNFLNLWQSSRNAAYVLVIAVLTFLGFMIMFGVELQAETKVTLQTALPRVVLGLLLITFSYAIGGLFIDSVSVIKSLLKNIFGVNWGGLGNIARDLVYNISGVASPADGGIIGQMAMENVVLSLGWILLFTVIALLTLILLIVIFIRFIFEWANLFLRTTFGPFFILLDIIPKKGKSTSFAWIRSLLASSVTIPLMGFALWVAHQFAVADLSAIKSPGFISTTSTQVNYIAAFGLLFMIPIIPSAVRRVLGDMIPDEGGGIPKVW